MSLKSVRSVNRNCLERNKMQNPKLSGSNIIDCIPQTGECPIKCGHELNEDCFYNGGKFYRTLNEPLFPTIEESINKIVRVNSGHDSNIDRNMVISSTEKYKQKFYNTSIPNFDFPGPVVFTCNGNQLHLINPAKNIMFVRVRVSMWNLDDVDKAVDCYLIQQKIPVVLTFMRYYKEENIKPEFKEYYVFTQHILNSYWCLTPEGQKTIMLKYKGTGVKTCGTPYSSFCVDCGNCELLYYKFMKTVLND